MKLEIVNKSTEELKVAVKVIYSRIAKIYPDTTDKVDVKDTFDFNIESVVVEVIEAHEPIK